MLAGGWARDLGSSRMLGSFIFYNLVNSHQSHYWAHCDSDLVTVPVTLTVIIISNHIKSYHVNEYLSLCCPTWFCFLRAFSLWPELILLTI